MKIETKTTAVIKFTEQEKQLIELSQAMGVTHDRCSGLRCSKCPFAVKFYREDGSIWSRCVIGHLQGIDTEEEITIETSGKNF